MSTDIAYPGSGSHSAHDSYVRHEIERIRPERVVDFGAGVGKMGRICREVLGSAVHITAVEGCTGTIAILNKAGIYDRIDQALLQDWIATNTSRFDLAIFGAVLCLLPRRKVFQAINHTLDFATHVIVTDALRLLLHRACDLNPLVESRAWLTERDFDRRYRMVEKHILRPEANGYQMINAWIIGRRRFDLKGFVKEKLLMYTGRTGRLVLERLGYDSFPRD